MRLEKQAMEMLLFDMQRNEIADGFISRGVSDEDAHAAITNAQASLLSRVVAANPHAFDNEGRLVFAGGGQ